MRRKTASGPGMPCRLRKEEIVTLQVLAEKGQANTEVARTLGVNEGTVR